MFDAGSHFRTLCHQQQAIRQYYVLDWWDYCILPTLLQSGGGLLG